MHKFSIIIILPSKVNCTHFSLSFNKREGKTELMLGNISYEFYHLDWLSFNEILQLVMSHSYYLFLLFCKNYGFVCYSDSYFIVSELCGFWRKNIFKKVNLKENIFNQRYVNVH